jgi:hypothetical protein
MSDNKQPEQTELEKLKAELAEKNKRIEELEKEHIPRRRRREELKAFIDRAEQEALCVVPLDDVDYAIIECRCCGTRLAYKTQ